MEKIKVSILVPVYKCEQFIQKCCESLFAQTLNELECIFFDDGSPDRSVEIINEVLSHYPSRTKSVKIISTPENNGVAYVRNQLIHKACGKYLLFVDSDDYIEPDTASLLYKTAEQHNADVVSFDFLCENKKRTSLRNFHYTSLQACLFDVVSNNWGVVWRFLFKKEVIDKSRIMFPHGLQGGEDYVFCVKFLVSSKNIATLSKPLYHYVTYNTSSLITTQNLGSLYDQYKATQIVEEYLKEKGDADIYSKALDMRKYGVKSNIYTCIEKNWGTLFRAKIACAIRRYSQKIRTLIFLLKSKSKHNA